MPDVVGIGALNMDRVYLVERIGAAGEEIKIDSVSEESGGSAANTIAGLAGIPMAHASVPGWSARVLTLPELRLHRA